MKYVAIILALAISGAVSTARAADMGYAYAVYDLSSDAQRGFGIIKYGGMPLSKCQDLAEGLNEFIASMELNATAECGVVTFEGAASVAPSFCTVPDDPNLTTEELLAIGKACLQQ